MRRALAAALLLAVALAGAAGGAGFVVWRGLTTPLSLEEPSAVLEVPAGAPLRRVSAELASRGMLRHPQLLAWYGRLTGAATRIRAGEYELHAGMTPLELLDKLVDGQVRLHQLTVVEGWRFADLLRALRSHPAISPTEPPAQAVMAELGEPALHPEGQFLPDTYAFPKGTTDIALLRLAHEALDRVLTEAWAHRVEHLAVETPYEVLVLASIIEKETSLDSERPLIAGVFNERLKRGMRLQTDPTVIYGLGDVYDGDLRRRDLAADTPYNTYTRGGLPPTPIALPSAASIEAAAAPAQTDALYFVATGLPDGSHHFSATLEEHNRAVARYLDRLRSAPEQR